MTTESHRLPRLRRLERVRAIARQAAATEAARAEGTLAQLLALAQRTRLLAADYAVPRGMGNGAALRRLTEFAGGLQTIAARTSGDADTARGVADSRMVDLAAAERRRAAVEERMERHARSVAKAGESPAVGARKALGTGLEE